MLSAPPSNPALHESAPHARPLRARRDGTKVACTSHSRMHPTLRHCAAASDTQPLVQKHLRALCTGSKAKRDAVSTECKQRAQRSTIQRHAGGTHATGR